MIADKWRWNSMFWLWISYFSRLKNPWCWRLFPSPCVTASRPHSAAIVSQDAGNRVSSVIPPLHPSLPRSPSPNIVICDKFKYVYANVGRKWRASKNHAALSALCLSLSPVLFPPLCMYPTTHTHCSDLQPAAHEAVMSPVKEGLLLWCGRIQSTAAVEAVDLSNISHSHTEAEETVGGGVCSCQLNHGD